MYISNKDERSHGYKQPSSSIYTKLVALNQFFLLNIILLVLESIGIMQEITYRDNCQKLFFNH